MSIDHDIGAFIQAQLEDETTQWNLGTFGAIAEFVRDPGEAVILGPLSAATARGAIGFSDLDHVRLFASETALGETWGHRIAMCLPEDACAMNRRVVLTELGPDTNALRAEDREAVLFDMGLGTLQADICIRTADPELIGALRKEAGRSLFASGNTAMGAIVARGPHRVFMARFGRCEVYQPIPPADGRSPEGPHTHVLPKLLAHNRTHTANESVPDGFVPCAHLVPKHPIKDAMGKLHPFDQRAHDAFQTMLGRFGDPDLYQLKGEITAAIEAGAAPSTVTVPAGRFARHTGRVAVRQVLASNRIPDGFNAWLAALGGFREEVDETSADPYGHA